MAYNGWKNWETWNIVLWASNEEGPYHFVLDNRPYTAEKAAEIAFEMYPNGTPDMKGPAELVKVDWEEVATAWNEE